MQQQQLPFGKKPMFFYTGTRALLVGEVSYGVFVGEGASLDDLMTHFIGVLRVKMDERHQGPGTVAAYRELQELKEVFAEGRKAWAKKDVEELRRQVAAVHCY